MGSNSRWHQDIEVSQLIEHLDRPERYGKWENLTAAEQACALKEMDRCRKDFVYAARNYFWIANKKLGDQLFSLWPSQELILQKIQEIKARGLPQKLIIIKARQLGCSTLLEGLICWRTVFFSNVNALVVSKDINHAAYVLWPIMQFIYDRLPWWLQPMTAMRKAEEGLVFANPRYDERRNNPGLNSVIHVKGAQSGGVGQGIRLSAVHFSEFCFNPNTIVRLSDGTLKPITEVNPGDRVITSKGTPASVKSVTKTPRANELTSEIYLYGNPIPLSTTRDHMVLTPDGYREAMAIKSGDYVSVPVRGIGSGQKTFSISERPIGKKTTPAPKEFPCSFGWGWFMGFYLSEGCARRNNKLRGENAVDSLHFGIHRKEEEYCISKIKKVLGDDYHVGKGRHTSLTTTLRVQKSGLARFVEENFGSTDNKRIPEWVWDCGYEFCKGLLVGYLEGDGHFNPTNGCVAANSIRPAITIQIRDLGASLGYGWATLYFREAGFHYGRRCKPIWTAHFWGDSAKSIHEAANREYGGSAPQKDRKSHWRYSSDRKYIEVEVESNTEGYCKEFYDLSVDGATHDFCTIQCCVHNCDVDDSLAKEIIDEDMGNALVEDANTFAVLESTAKGANRYSHKLWKRCVELERDAEWFPLFLPWFFEDTRRRTVTVDFHLEKEEIRMQDRVAAEWVRCDNPPCLQYHLRFVRGEDRAETTCVTCQAGTVHAYILSDDQLNWIQHRRKNSQRDDESAKKLKQEMCVTSEEAFQISAIQLFGPKAQEFVNSCIRPPIAFGDFDVSGKFHGENAKAPKRAGQHGLFHPCFQEDCGLDHSFDENPLLIWEWPEPKADYCIGADVAEGLGGKADFSVGATIKYSNSLVPNRQVATWRSNTVEPIHFASKLYHLGYFYNMALLSVEVNKFDICIGSLRFNLNYPNLYRWKHIDSVNVLSQKLGWETNIKSRPRLWQTMRAWLNHEMFVIRSSNAYSELVNFVKNDEQALFGGADMDEKDDEAMALMISLFCATEGQYNEQLGLSMPRSELTMASAAYHITCMGCAHLWPEMVVSDPLLDGSAFHPELDANGRVSQAGGTRCPICGSLRISIQRNTAGRIMRTDADIVLRQQEDWTPDQAFEDAEFLEYDEEWAR